MHKSDNSLQFIHSKFSLQSTLKSILQQRPKGLRIMFIAENEEAKSDQAPNAIALKKMQ